MGRPLLPPRGVFIPTRLIFDNKLPATVRDTLVQLIALAWGSPEHELPRLSFPQLVGLTGKCQATLHNHFAILKAYHSALRLRVSGDGLISVTIAGWLYSVSNPSNSRNLESDGVKEEDQDQKEEEDFLPPPPDDLDQDLTRQNAPIHTENAEIEGGLPKEVPKKLGGATPEDEATLPNSLRKELIQAGVFSFLLPEVARSGRSRQNLLALLAWCEEDKPEKPGQLFMVRLRLGVEVPARYFGERCPVCHRVGKHSDQCRRRYLEGIPGD